MLILLPPSEGKAEGGTGGPVDLTALSWPQLTTQRQRALKALVSISRRSPARARELLGLSPGLDRDRAANAVADTAATMPAGLRYTGVLHDALGYATLSAAARRRADTSVVVFSGLWGAVRPTDMIPAYRIGIATTLPSIGPLPAFWRNALRAALDEEIATRGALDLRSSGYAQMYRPSAPAAGNLLAVRVTGPDGTKAAPSYQSKVAKGRLVRALLQRGTPKPSAVAEAAASVGLSAEAHDNQITLKAPVGWGLIGEILPP